jgi:hypothetical protein
MQLTEQDRKFLVEETYRQLALLSENTSGEGFAFGGKGRKSDGYFRFFPGKYDTRTSTRMFDDNGNMQVRRLRLPKSGIMSYNLYKIEQMPISRALKHPEELNGKIDTASIEKFMKRTALYIKHLLGDRWFDYITCPQSSSQFSANMISYLLRLYPNSQAFKFVPNMLTKNVRKVYVNTELAKQIGMSDAEIHNLQQRVDKWKSDEDLRDLRRKIQALEEEIAQAMQNRGRGRPSRDFTNKVDMLNAYKKQINGLRIGKRGIDPTVDKEGNVKDFQIKSINDTERRALEGLFEINPEYNGIQQKLVGKTVLVFDDNISSGATLDDVCLALKRIGVKDIIPITLAIIPKNVYGSHERLKDR